MSTKFDNFIKIVKKLRDPESGCPWDLEQNHSSLRPYLIEESYEVLAAIDSRDDAALKDELGDVLLQVVLHSQLASERGAFNIEDVINTVAEKMVRRHPHVFGDLKVDSSQDVLKNWEQIKLTEGGQEAPDSVAKNHRGSLVSKKLKAIPHNIPALLRAQRVGEKASRVGFDWQEPTGVWEKLQEELGELAVEIQKVKGEHTEGAPKIICTEEQRKALEHELGDTLFCLSQLARWLEISAEDSLRVCINRFLARFSLMEELAAPCPLHTLPAEKLEELWELSKKNGAD